MSMTASHRGNASGIAKMVFNLSSQNFDQMIRPSVVKA